MAGFDIGAPHGLTKFDSKFHNLRNELLLEFRKHAIDRFVVLHRLAFSDTSKSGNSNLKRYSLKGRRERIRVQMILDNFGHGPVTARLCLAIPGERGPSRSYVLGSAD